MPTDHAEKIFFYLPYRKDGIAELPKSLDEYWPWLLRRGKINKGKYSWTLQSYLQLKAHGFECSLVERFPTRGIVVAHRDFLPIFLRPRAGVFLVCIKPDRKEHTWAQYYIVQNGKDSIFGTRKGRGRTAALPFWPQPSLMPRSAERGTSCSNVAYLGRNLNLAPELRTEAWKSALADLGLVWSSREIERWNDYRDVDVTVAVRNFDQQSISNSVFDPDSKPPSKLINSWLAGVPAILGAESAYQAVRRSPLDYVEVSSPAELKAALVRLRDDAQLYREMVDHGRRRAEGFSAQAVCRRWIEIFELDMRGALERWRDTGVLGRQLTSVREIAEYLTSTRNLKDLLTIFK